jgi:acetate---CoA ligase (ADP-forming)
VNRLLDPKTVAFIGGERAAYAIQQSELLGFAGTIWPVNPSRSELGGHPTFASVADLPTAPDAAFVAVDRVRSIEVVAALREMGCGGVVCYASGFAESGDEGAELQRRLMEAAGDMPLIGPNCHGYVNALSGAVLWPDVQGCRRVDRGVGIVTQSGNLAINMTMQRRGLPLAMVVTLGNQAGVGIEDVVESMVDDDRITAIGLHLEALSEPPRFARAALRAGRLGKPLVVLKTGLSDVGAVIARTHTASLAGSGAAYRALFERYGIAQVSSVGELLSTLAVLAAYGPLPGRRLTSLSCSGGEAGLIADRAAGRAVRFEPFPAATAERIAATLSHRVPITNPLDYHTFIWGDRSAMTACFTETLSAPVDAGILIIDFPVEGADDSLWWPTVESFLAAHRTTGTPVVVTATLPENLPHRVVAWLAEQGVPAIPGIDETLAALEAAGTGPPGSAAHHPSPGDPGQVRALDEREAKAILAAGGVAVPPGRMVGLEEVEAMATEIGFPMVVKAVGIDHKSDAGGVVVGVSDLASLRTAADQVGRISDRLLVERFIPGAVAELVVGIRREHPIGWTVTIGTGGELVELAKDSVTLLAPLTDTDIEAAIGRLRAGRLMAGYRGRPSGDMAATVTAVRSIVETALTTPGMVELEVNPLLVLPDGAWAVDALAVVEVKGTQQS